jgi:hypothetical protein
MHDTGVLFLCTIQQLLNCVFCSFEMQVFVDLDSCIVCSFNCDIAAAI